MTPARDPGQCLNCAAGLTVDARFCAACGQKARPPRLSLGHIGHELVHAIVHVDRSVLSLVRLLLLMPGVVAREYVEGKRQRYYGPFAFLVVVVAFASGLIAISGFRVVTSSVPNPASEFIQGHINLVFFVQVPLLAALSRLLDVRGGRYNYAEYLVLASYTSAMHILFYALVIVPAWYVFRPSPDTAGRLVYLYAPLWPIYFAYATSQFLAGRRTWGAIKGLIAALATQGITITAISTLVLLYVRTVAPA